jgi:hypothetical protein
MRGEGEWGAATDSSERQQRSKDKAKKQAKWRQTKGVHIKEHDYTNV